MIIINNIDPKFGPILMAPLTMFYGQNHEYDHDRVYADDKNQLIMTIIYVQLKWPWPYYNDQTHEDMLTMTMICYQC